MKFEHLLHIYWLQGFLYGGFIIPFRIKLYKLPTVLSGLARASLINIEKKFELTTFLKRHRSCIFLSAQQRWALNFYFSYLISVNNSFNEMIRLHAVRLYLVKSYRGLRQAVGKPSRGQRTRSNANTSYKNSNNIKDFIAVFYKTHEKIEAITKINYRIVQKKLKKK